MITKRVHRMPFGAQVEGDTTRFAVFAPDVRDVTAIIDCEPHPLQATPDGWREVKLPNAGAGTRYIYALDGGTRAPDPASRYQPDGVHEPSAVVDPLAFEWSDAEWRGRPWAETVVVEVHVGTATPEGTFAALTAKLEHWRDLGATAIELMPLSDCPGTRNWGYDGVAHFAPNASYGAPDDLKRLIDRAHAFGLMIFIDVVYNHFGPSGNYLHAFSKRFFTERHQTPWGGGLAFDEQQAVRDFFLHNALYWIEEFNADGLRFDAVHAIADDGARHILAEIAETIRATFHDRHIHLILENEENEAKWLERDSSGKPLHYTAQWNDDVHHCWHVLMTGESEGYYADYLDNTVARLARGLAEGFVFQGESMQIRDGKPRGESSAHLPPTAFVSHVQNHDQIGNRAFGERLSLLTTPEKLALAHAGLILSPQIPMLFMGEEWSASAPFQFFVDFSEDPELSKAIREGRRREFRHFRAFADEAAAARIPDPTDEKTFLNSKIDWSEMTREPHASALADMRNLVAIRHREIVPLIRSRSLGANYEAADDLLKVEWRFEAGSLGFAANFAKSARTIELPSGARLIWQSPTARVDGGRAHLEPWAGVSWKMPA
jgi:maltooligosyltrehalose trehalohydrolase